LSEKPLYTENWVHSESAKQQLHKALAKLRELPVDTIEKIFCLHGGPPEAYQLAQKEKEALYRFAHVTDDRIIEVGDLIDFKRTGPHLEELYFISHVMRIIEQNKFDRDVYDGISRFNHACDANAVFVKDPRTKLGQIQVVRDIEAGAEITLCYADAPVLTEKERKQKLEEKYGFTCDCNWCGSESKDRAKYEKKRIELYLAQRTGPKKSNAAELYEFALRNIDNMNARGYWGQGYCNQ